MGPHLNIVFCLLAAASSVWAGPQAVTVKGIVNCRGHRQPGTFIQLYDEDSVPIIDDDDLLGSVIADHRGVFCVKGWTHEATTIEPYIMIEHNCGYEGLNEKRTYIHQVPQEFINDGEKAKVIYHLGDIELLTEDAPVQKYEKRIYVETSIDERIRQCIPIYVQYKQFYEEQIRESEVNVQLPTDGGDVAVVDEYEPTTEEVSFEHESEEVGDSLPTHSVSSAERTEIEIERLREEEERVRLEQEQLKLEEESRRVAEQRRLEEERIREEERKLQEEKIRFENEKREEERLKEEARRAEEEKKRAEEIRLAEQRRLEQEEIHKKRLEEYYKREEERKELLRQREEELKRREEERSKIQAVPAVPVAVPCVNYPVIKQTIGRSMESRAEYVEDPCLRK